MRLGKDPEPDNFHADRWLNNYALKQIQQLGPWDRVESRVMADETGVLFRLFSVQRSGLVCKFLLSPDVANIQCDPELYVDTSIRHHLEWFKRECHTNRPNSTNST